MSVENSTNVPPPHRFGNEENIGGWIQAMKFSEVDCDDEAVW